MENISIAEEIKKLKGLMDEGLITPEEFEVQKKRILAPESPATPPVQSLSSEPTQYISPPNAPRKKKMHGCLVALIVVAAIIVGIIALSLIVTAASGGFSRLNNSNQSEPSIASQKEETPVVLDAMQFYVNNSETVSADKLIEMLGEPSEVEDWNYAVNDDLSYPIHTLYYSPESGGSYAYHFNNGVLQWLSIDDVEIPYTDKNNILAMFGLKKYTNSVVEADTGFAYRVSNCGVRSLWISIMDENSIQSVRISYGKIL